MDYKIINKVIEDCNTLESVILALANNVSTRHRDLFKLQDHSIDSGKRHLNTLLKREKELEDQLQALKLDKNKLDNKNNSITSLNDQISTILTIINSPSDDRDHNQEFYVKISEHIQELDHLKNNLIQICQEVETLKEGLLQVISDVHSEVAQNIYLSIQLHKKKNIIRILTQQNKSAEEQFDVILNQLPWEALTDEQIAQLRHVNPPQLKAVVDAVQLQTIEIRSLNKSIIDKKERKLEILSNFVVQLDNFMNERHGIITLHKF